MVGWWSNLGSQLALGPELAHCEPAASEPFTPPPEGTFHSMSGQSTPLLSVRGVTLRFGGVVALDDVSFDVMPGQIAGLIGPNGAGKTTLFNCLSRLYQPSTGEIIFEGQSVLSVRRHKIPMIGIGRTFQNVALFDRLTVLQNVMVGRHSRTSAGFVENAFRLPAVGREEKAVREKAMDLIEFMNLTAFTDRIAHGLPFPFASAWNLPVRWPPNPSCCCWTSQPPA